MKESTLYVNACVRKDSRTRKLAEKLLIKMGRPYDELCLESVIFPIVNEDYLNKRDQLISMRDFQNPMFSLARQFSEAKTIVIAAPFWDLSFPAMLKQYFEQINVVGITFKYSEDGVPKGLCLADRLFYVTTAGGYFVPEEYGFGYIKALAQNYYGIQDVRQVTAVGLDVDGTDIDAILRAAEGTLSEMDLN